MSVKVLRIPTCLRIVKGQRIAPGIYATSGDGSARPRYCGRTSIAVLRHQDGQERFVCDEHVEAAPAAAESWRLHRREVAAAPFSRAAVASRVTSTGRPKRPVSAQARANMAAGQRARWARNHDRGLRRAS